MSPRDPSSPAQATDGCERAAPRRWHDGRRGRHLTVGGDAPRRQRVWRAHHSARTSTSTWRSSAAASPGCGPRCSLATADPDAAHRRARAPRHRVRGERPQRRLVLGAAGDRACTGYAAAHGARGRRRRATRHARDRRRDRPVRGDRARRRRVAPRRHRHVCPLRRPAPRRPGDVDEARAFGFGDEDVRWLTTDEIDAVGRPPGTLGRGRSRRTARCVHPLRLVHAIARAATDAGVALHTHTAVEVVEPRRLVTSGGTVRAGVVVLATEAYTAMFAERHRDVAPVYSLMVGSDVLTPRSGTPSGCRATDVPRRPAHGRLRAAHGRRPHRVRRPRRAVPLRVADRPRLRPGRAGAHDARRRGPRALPAARATWRSRSTGAGRWASPGTGAGACATTGPRYRRGRRLRRRRGLDDEPRRAHARRPDPRARHRARPACRGSGTAPARGSRNRCAGSASTSAASPPPAPTPPKPARPASPDRAAAGPAPRHAHPPLTASTERPPERRPLARASELGVQPG